MDRLRCFGPSSSTLGFFSLLLPLFFFISNAAFNNLSTIPFNSAYSPLFGDGNLVRAPDGKGVRLLLDRFTGILFIHQSLRGWFFHGSKRTLFSYCLNQLTVVLFI
jgi:xyloglucan:xyloglucosyl transferase